MLARALLLVSSVHGANLDLTSNVVELTTSNFAKTSEGLWLLEFCATRMLTPVRCSRSRRPYVRCADAPWCGHCKKLAPTYERVATYFAKSGSSVHVAKIDGTEHQVCAGCMAVCTHGGTHGSARSDGTHSGGGTHGSKACGTAGASPSR